MRTRRIFALCAHRRTRLRQIAFSLVEVVMAIGIVCFAIISLMGLVGISIQTGKRASDDTQVAMLAKVTLSTFLSDPFDQLGNKTEYFDNDGTPLTSANNAYYQCTITVTEPSTDLKAVSMRFKWPVAATNQQVINEQFFLTSVADY